MIDSGHPLGDAIDLGEIMRYISIKLTDEDFEHLSMAKGDRTWREYIMKDLLNQAKRKELQRMIGNEELRCEYCV